VSVLKQWHKATLGQRVVAALQKKGFTAAYFENREQAVEHILDRIPPGATVGIGGSTTLREIGVVDLLREKGYVLYDHNAPGLQPEERTVMRYKQLSSDVFLTSTNALTLKGELVNRDAVGNRVASMFFGPKKVIVVAGVNKIVKDIDAADARIKMVAAPMNVKRLETPNPCLKIGECADCQNPTRICNITTIIHRRPSLTDVEVVIIGEELGF